MSSPLIKPTCFEVNNGAQKLHEMGLKQELNQDFQLADQTFDDALYTVSSTPENILPQPDKKVQIGRILRDKGFNLIRFSIINHSLGLYSDGYDSLDKSETKFYGALSNLSVYSGFLAKSEVDKLKESINAERGATISLMARAITAREVVFEVKNGNNEAIRQYERAHSHLITGDNGYYRVSNAMVAARHEKINSKNTKMVNWLGKAVVGLGFTLFQDKRNLKPAVFTFGSRLLDLSSKTKAEQSVKSKP